LVVGGVSEAESGSLIVGRIGGVYGIRGWLKIHSYTEPMENLLGYGNWRISRKSGWQAIEIDAGRRHGKGLIAHIVGVDDREQAAEFKGCEIGVPMAELPTLEEDEYYWHQLEGLSVYSGEALLGSVHHLLETGANDVLVIRPCTGSMDKRERLVPWLVPSVIKAVDVAGGRITVAWDPEF
jgi:16S rRNA processing protein RimM